MPFRSCTFSFTCVGQMWPQYLTISLAPTRPGRQLNALETGLRFITNLVRTDNPERWWIAIVRCESEPLLFVSMQGEACA
jgi:flavin reductase (DIM6/NTAB) family NADH-FMN oxidoreductase RutF